MLSPCCWATIHHGVAGMFTQIILSKIPRMYSIKCVMNIKTALNAPRGATDIGWYHFSCGVSQELPKTLQSRSFKTRIKCRSWFAIDSLAHRPYEWCPGELIRQTEFQRSQPRWRSDADNVWQTNKFSRKHYCRPLVLSSLMTSVYRRDNMAMRQKMTMCYSSLWDKTSRTSKTCRSSQEAWRTSRQIIINCLKFSHEI